MINSNVLKIVYRKAVMANKLLTEIKEQISENGGINSNMYIIHDAIDDTKKLIQGIEKCYIDTLHEE